MTSALSALIYAYRWTILKIVGFCVFFALTYVMGIKNGEEIAREQCLLEAEKLRQAQMQEHVARAEKTVEVITKYVDRERIVKVQGETVIKKVPIYVSKESDSQCVVPVGFVRMRNAAAGAVVPDPTSAVDARASVASSDSNRPEGE